MIKKFLSFIIMICLIIPSAFIFVACGEGDLPKITFNFYSEEQLVKTIELGKDPIEIPLVTKDGYIFDYWAEGSIEGPAIDDFIFQMNPNDFGNDTTYNIYAVFCKETLNPSFPNSDIAFKEFGNIRIKYRPDVETLNLDDYIIFPEGTTYKAYFNDVLIEDNLIDLDTHYYIQIVVTDSNNESKTYCVNFESLMSVSVWFEGLGVIEVIEGDLITPPDEIPENPGYVFDGWDYDFTQPVTKDSFSISILAKWKPYQPVYTFNYYMYDENNEYVKVYTQVIEYSEQTGYEFTPYHIENMFVKKGYFCTWWDSGIGFGFGALDSDDSTYEADDYIYYGSGYPTEYDMYLRYDEFSISINYENVDGSYQDPISNNNISNFNYEMIEGEYEGIVDGVITLNNAERNYYDFLGWYKDENLTTEVESIDIDAMYSRENPDESITLYAKWEKTRYNVVYHMGIGRDESNSEENPVSLTHFDDSVYLENPYRKGLNFLGWYSDSDYQNPIDYIPAGVDEDINIYAKFEYFETTIFFSSAYYYVWSERFGSYDQYNVVLADGYEGYFQKTFNIDDEPYEFPIMKAKNDIATMEKWNITEGDRGDGADGFYMSSFNPATDCYDSERAIYLYARWVPTEYSITYHIPDDCTYDPEDEYTELPETYNFANYSYIYCYSLEKLGYDFTNSWSVDTTKNATFGDMVGDSMQVDSNFEKFGDVELTPIFEIVDYNITFALDDETDTSDFNYQNTNETTFTILDEVDLVYPTKLWFTCVGLYNNETFEGEPITKIEKGSHTDVTIYPKWEENVYTITYNEGSDFSFNVSSTEEYTYSTRYVYFYPVERPNYYPKKLNLAISGFNGDVVETISGYGDRFNLPGGDVSVSVTWQTYFKISNGYIYGFDSYSTKVERIIYVDKNTGLKTVKIPGYIDGVGDIIGVNYLAITGVEALIIEDGVVDISNNAFGGGNSALKQITLANTVKTIGENAFKSASALTTINFSEGLETIKANAFEGCTSLENILLPESLKTIETKAFYNTKIKHIKIPNGISSLSVKTFDNDLLEEMTIAKGNKGITLADDYSLLIKKLIVEDDVTINFARTATYWGAKYAYTNFVFGNNVKATFDSYYLRMASCFKSFIVGDGCELILNNGAFYNINSFTTFAYGENIKFVERYKDSDGEYKLRENSIAAETFANCYNFEGFVIPESVKRISNDAFRSTKLFQLGELHSNIEYIGDQALMGTPIDIEVVDFTSFNNLTYLGKSLFSYNKDIVKVILPQRDIILGGGMFNGCENLYEITLYSEITKIEEYFFFGCTELKFDICAYEKLTEIGNYAFKNTAISDGLAFYDTIEYIGDEAFMGCNITTVQFGYNSKLRHMGKNVFAGNALLEKLYLPYIGCELVDGVNTESLKYIVGDMTTEDNVPVLKELYIVGTKQTTLAKDTFIDAAGLEKIQFPSTLTTINCVFSDVVNLKEVDLTRCKSLTGVNIVDNAFSGCVAIEKVVLPGSLGTIPNGMFNGCTNLSNLTIGYGISTIGEGAFRSCSLLEKLELPNSVTHVYSQAFGWCDKISDITLSNTLQEIAGSAFTGIAITSINFPASLTTIGQYAFSGCAQLTSVVIPETVTSMGNSVFSDCENLRRAEILITSSEATIGNSIFVGCIGLAQLRNLSTKDSASFITYDTNPIEILTTADASFTSSFTEDENFVLFNYNGKVSLINVKDDTKKEIVIPAEVTHIPENLFLGNTVIKKVTFEEGSRLIAIGDLAFYQSTLEYIEIPAGVSRIRYRTFYQTTSLESVIFAQGSALRYIDESAFGQTGLKEITLPNNVEIIEKLAFAQSEIETINIPVSVTTINEKAFYNCTGLQSISIPKLVTSLGNYIFQGATGLKTATFATDCTFTIIPTGMFMGCSSLEEIVIPASVTAINSSAFKYCLNMTLSYAEGSNLKIIYKDAFYGAGKGTLTFPEGFTTINNYAFEYSTFDKVVLPEGLGYIGAYSFYNSKVSEVEFDENFSWTGIEQGMFMGCVNLEEIKLPASVNSIFKEAFKDSGLETIDWSSCELIYFAEGAFTNTKITSVEVPYTLTRIDSYVFSNCDNLTTVTFAEGSTYTTIGNYMFGGCSSLTSVTLPETIESIAIGAFQNCTALKTWFVPESVTEICQTAFAYTGFESIILHEGLLTIGQSAFYCCANLNYIQIPSSVTSVGQTAVAYGKPTVIYVCLPEPTDTSIFNSNWHGNGDDKVVWNYTYDQTKTHTVSFYDDEGNLLAQIEVNEREEAVYPLTGGVPEKDGSAEGKIYMFDGWKTEKGGYSIAALGSIYEDISVYADYRYGYIDEQ